MSKKIIITGGAGFIGSSMVRALLSDPSNHVLNIDNLTYAGNLSSISTIKNHNYTFLKTDIVDETVMKEVFLTFQPDCIVHFAAESHVDRSIEGPSEFLRTNIIGTFSLLEAARFYLNHISEKKSFRFHHISTDEVFGSLGSTGLFSEKTAYDPRSPYSATKASSDHLVRAWHHTYDLPITISNCSNNYGPFQFPEKLIPLTILSALHQQPIPVYGDGQNIRDWIYVDDHIAAILLILEKGVNGETYNIGGYGEKTNLEVVNTICNLLDEKFQKSNQDSFSNLITFVQDRLGHDYRYAINPSKIEKELGWKPKETFKTGMEKTVEWYIQNIHWWKPMWDKKPSNF